MRKTFTVCILLCCCLIISAQTQYTQIFDPHFKTLEVKNLTSRYNHPVLDMSNADDYLTISFDELSHDMRNLSYTVVHCNADWSIDNLSRFEYIDGAEYAEITDYETSVNTYVAYTHYQFRFPNEEMHPIVSGNFLIRIYEDSDPDKILLQTRCHLVDMRTDINANIRANTDIDLVGKHQQIDFEVTTDRMNILNPASDLKTVIRQNGRTDNEAFGIKPTALFSGKVSYANSRECIFEAGNEYRILDISNRYVKDFDVKDILLTGGMFHVEMLDAHPRTAKYDYYTDADGKFIINLQRNAYDDQTEADYYWVHFFLPAETPFFDSRLFVTGDFDQQLLNHDNEMEYDAALNGYRASFLLKQGGYNYLYLLKKKGEQQGSCLPFEGSFWQTENEYEIFVYYRPIQGRFDQLVGYKIVRN
ncbi:MAG: DUF5103 domain-containing protein [Bacteroidales bacterium]|nr:DUF5103 domain-containing protein [Bacteroidales bacterium]